jgi:hypothetical protein
MIDTKCRDTFMCDANCDPNDMACFFTCQATYGLEQKAYTAVSNCIADNGCMDPVPDDGECVVTDNAGIDTITTIEQMRGTWWTIRGVNKDFDYAPCQQGIYEEVAGSNGRWINNVTWENPLVDPPEIMDAEIDVYIDGHGIVINNYTKASQVETWHVLSQPSDDYMLVYYCGVNPILNYAGGYILGKDKIYQNMPQEYEEIFREAAAANNFDYDQMFWVDNAHCENRDH